MKDVQSVSVAAPVTVDEAVAAMHSLAGSMARAHPGKYWGYRLYKDPTGGIVITSMTDEDEPATL